MKHVNLGATGITASALALGCDRLGSILTPMTRGESLSLISEALELGINHFDTSSIYGQGDSERYVGSAIKGVRNRVCLATKAGKRLTSSQALIARVKAPLRLITPLLRKISGSSVRRQAALATGSDFSPSYIESSLFESLRRLDTDRVEIFYLHSPPPEALRDDRLLGFLVRQRDLGRIGAIGVSCDDLDCAMEAASSDLIEIVQFDLAEGSRCREIVETAAIKGKTSIVRGIARQAAHSGADFSATFVKGVISALALPSVGGVIVGTVNAHHLRSNVATLRRELSES